MGAAWQPGFANFAPPSIITNQVLMKYVSLPQLKTKVFLQFSHHDQGQNLRDLVESSKIFRP